MNKSVYNRITYLGSFTLFLGFFLIVATFWNSEIIIWNYSSFKIEQFSNSITLYGKTPMPDLKNQLQVLIYW